MKLNCTNNYINKFFVLCFLSILSIAAKAQNSNYLNDVTVNPPNAASLGKYGDIPISLHTGIPNVGIPIHTLTETGGLSVPVSFAPSTMRGLASTKIDVLIPAS